jgi:hypothetical protein
LRQKRDSGKEKITGLKTRHYARKTLRPKGLSYRLLNGVPAAYFFFFALLFSSTTACAAARREIGTRNGDALT